MDELHRTRAVNYRSHHFPAKVYLKREAGQIEVNLILVCEKVGFHSHSSIYCFYPCPAEEVLKMATEAVGDQTTLEADAVGRTGC